MKQRPIQRSKSLALVRRREWEFRNDRELSIREAAERLCAFAAGCLAVLGLTVSFQHPHDFIYWLAAAMIAVASAQCYARTGCGPFLFGRCTLRRAYLVSAGVVAEDHKSEESDAPEAAPIGIPEPFARVVSNGAKSIGADDAVSGAVEPSNDQWGAPRPRDHVLIEQIEAATPADAFDAAVDWVSMNLPLQLPG